MDTLTFDDLKLFSRVAALGTLSAVAREREVPVSQVSRALARIEKTCGARLIHRSTHGLALSAEGETLLAWCHRVTAALDELQGEFATHAREPAGLVRVAASAAVAQYVLVPSLPALHQRHPGLRVELNVSDRLVDLARDGIDIALRTGAALPDTLVARQVGTLGRGLYAAPAYVALAGLPAHPGELHRHALVTNSAVPALNLWPFTVEGHPLQWAAEGRWRSNDTGMVASMVLQGLGIGRIATLAAEPLVRRGLLVPVLDSLVDLQPVPIHAITAAARQRLPKLKACVDFWHDCFAHGVPD